MVTNFKYILVQCKKKKTKQGSSFSWDKDWLNLEKKPLCENKGDSVATFSMTRVT